MLSFLVFLISFILFLFEAGISFIFGKPLNSDILALASIMILPGMILLAQNDIQEFYSISQGGIGEKIARRKQMKFLLEKGIIYSILGGTLGLFFSGISYFLPSSTQLTYSLSATLGFLFLFSLLNIYKELYSSPV